jgi:hypothetical protein
MGWWGRERARESRGVRVTVAGKENARCCGVEIGHGDVGGLDMGWRSVSLARAGEVS